MNFSLPANMIVAGVAVKFDKCGGGHLGMRHNRHIVVKVAGRDCLLSPILAVCCECANRLRAVQFEHYKYHMFEMIAG